MNELEELEEIKEELISKLGFIERCVGWHEGRESAEEIIELQGRLIENQGQLIKLNEEIIQELEGIFENEEFIQELEAKKKTLLPPLKIDNSPDILARFRKKTSLAEAIAKLEEIENE
jgi:hypothetical protein